jgi:hypothetical protein
MLHLPGLIDARQKAKQGLAPLSPILPVTTSGPWPLPIARHDPISTLETEASSCTILPKLWTTSKWALVDWAVLRLPLTLGSMGHGGSVLLLQSAASGKRRSGRCRGGDDATLSSEGC